MRTPLPIESKIAGIIEPVMKDMGFKLVVLRIHGGKKHSSVQIFAEPLEDRLITLDECSKISKRVAVVLDVDDPIEGSYNLEVSSPGIERPLVEKEDFDRFQGLDVKIECTNPSLTGQKNYKGTLGGYKDGSVIIKTDAGEESLEYDNIHNAHLVYNEKLKAFYEAKKNKAQTEVEE